MRRAAGSWRPPRAIRSSSRRRWRCSWTTACYVARASDGSPPGTWTRSRSRRRSRRFWPRVWIGWTKPSGRLLGRAAIVGQSFYLGAVRELTPEDERGEIARRVQQLLRRDLIRPDPSDVAGEEAFRFHHVLLRDAAYQMLPKETRAEPARAVRRAWLGPARSDGRLGRVRRLPPGAGARYRVELGPEDDDARDLAGRAAGRLSAAANRATIARDAPATENLSRRAAALLADDDPRRAWDLMVLGSTLRYLERAEEANEAYEDALRTARTVGDERSEAHASLGSASSRWLVDPEGASDIIAELVQRLLPKFEDWGDERGLGMAYLMRSQIHWNACEFARSREDSALAAPHARAAGDGTFERDGDHAAGGGRSSGSRVRRSDPGRHRGAGGARVHPVASGVGDHDPVGG